jgi:hypothetical protein
MSRSTVAWVVVMLILGISWFIEQNRQPPTPEVVSGRTCEEMQDTLRSWERLDGPPERVYELEEDIARMCSE